MGMKINNQQLQGLSIEHNYRCLGLMIMGQIILKYNRDIVAYLFLLC